MATDFAQPAVSNRLHRSGAIDFNVEFATRQAQIFKSAKPCGKRIFGVSEDPDCLSVCEGEPLVTPKRHKGNQYTSPDSVRNPVSCISSLNGLCNPEGVHPFFNTAVEPNTTNAQTPAALLYHEKARDAFFKEFHYTGFAVSKWSYDRVGKQQDQFVATAGGLNTVYTDTDAQAGDTMVVDIPWSSEHEFKERVSQYDANSPNQGNRYPWGFVKRALKKGTPKEKQTLVVRAIPPLPEPPKGKEAEAVLLYALQIQMRKSFHRRGQVIGECVKGGKKGERIDIVHRGNAIANVNMSDWA